MMLKSVILIKMIIAMISLLCHLIFTSFRLSGRCSMSYSLKIIGKNSKSMPKR